MQLDGFRGAGERLVNQAKHILVMDRNPAVAGRLGELCRSRGWTITAAASAEQGIKAMLPDLPDVALIRDQLPGMPGYEVCRRIRSNPLCVGASLVFLSGVFPRIGFLKKLIVDMSVDRVVTAGDLESVCRHVQALTDSHAEARDWSEMAAREEYLLFLFRKMRRIEDCIRSLSANPLDTAALKELVIDVRTIRDTADANGYPRAAAEARAWAEALNELLQVVVEGHTDALMQSQRESFPGRLRRIFDQCQQERGRQHPAFLSHAAMRQQLRGADQATVRPPQILVVEDDPAIQKMVAFALRNRGMECEILSDGIAARERLLNGLPAPRVVLLDINLPGVDGLTILEELNRSGKIRAMRVIVISGHTREDFIVRAFDSGAYDYVTKPFSIPVLVRRVRRALD